MSVEPTVAVQSPGVLAETAIQDFIAMVCAGGEVGDAVLEENVRSAKCLVLGHQGSCLVAVAALKNPRASYRQMIQSKAGVALGVCPSNPFSLHGISPARG